MQREYAEALRQLDAMQAEQCRRSLHRFLRDVAWPALQPATKFVDNWHVGAICEHLQAVTDGQIRRLVINLPFRMLKSTIVSQAWPAWEWVNHPHLQYLTASYAKDVATRDAVDTRRVIESALYQRYWGTTFRMTGDQNVKTRYENNRRGARVVTSTDSAGTGFGGNRIIVDDPVSALEADSEQARAMSIEWWKGTAATRLNNPKGDAIVLVHQRLHRDDLTGYVLENEAGWEHLVLPMRYDPELRKTTSLGFVDPRKTAGELLSPERLDEPTVKEMEARLGAYHTAAQLQQNPGSRDGAIFKRKDWRYFRVPVAQQAESMDEIIWSWDCAFKDNAASDFVAGFAIGRKGADKYLLRLFKDRLSFGGTKEAVRQEAAHPHFLKKLVAVLVEDKANGPAVVDELKSQIAALTPVTPQGGKVARANSVQPQHEAGNLYLPDPDLPECEWVRDFVQNAASFPDVAHDDDVDAFTQGVRWFTSRENEAEKSPPPRVGGRRVFN